MTLRFSWNLKRSLYNPVSIPIVFVLSSLFLFSFISVPGEQIVFILFATAIHYFLFLGLYRLSRAPQDLSARAMVSMSIIVTMFFFYSVAYGFYINFAIPLWFFMTLYGAASFAVTYPFLRSLTTDQKIVSLYSLVIALALAEIAWVVNFWPFGYLTSGVVVLMFFYVFFDLAQHAILQTLSKRRTIVHSVTFFFLLLMVLWSSRWLPVN
jgi:hypothetical protein